MLFKQFYPAMPVNNQASIISRKTHNDKMEPINCEIRDREKVIRGVKREDTPLLTGPQIYHNYVRPHMGLDSKIPAELARVRIKRKNKWATLIQNASAKKCAN